MSARKKWFKRGIGLLMAIFIFMNIIAIFHSYKFTHFANTSKEKTKDPSELTLLQKLKTLAFGINNPRPENIAKPKAAFETIRLQSNKEIECWSIKTKQAKGTVILFHGFSGEKSQMLDQAIIFQQLGFNTLLVDFMGSGGSEGNQTTIGFMEAEQVKASFDYVASQGETNIYLYGTSMGAVAIMKSVADYQINPKAIIIECPFGSMYQTVCARFRTMNAPVFPMAGLLVFWGGIQNGFWAFGHNPTTYAEEITCPTLLMYGEKDDKVSKEEIDQIFINLKGEKELDFYPEAGHESYLIKYKSKWTKSISNFLNKNQAFNHLYRNAS